MFVFPVLQAAQEGMASARSLQLLIQSQTGILTPWIVYKNGNLSEGIFKHTTLHELFSSCLTLLSTATLATVSASKKLCLALDRSVAIS